MAKSTKIRQLILPVIALTAVILAGCNGSAHFRVDEMYCNNRINPIGVEGVPDLRWTVVSDRNGAAVSRYEIRIKDKETLKLEDLKTITFEAGRKYEWQVRVKDEKGNLIVGLSRIFP